MLGECFPRQGPLLFFCRKHQAQNMSHIVITVKDFNCGVALLALEIVEVFRAT